MNNVIELKLPPVVQFLVVMAGMWLLAKYVPALSVDIPGRKLLVVALGCLGGVVAVPAIAAFRSAGTTVDPRRPAEASRLVVRGVYRYSRNPMYLGLLCLLGAWAFFLSNLLAFVGLPLFVLAMNRLQIRPEEAAMLAQFGDEYRRYCEKVRRWI
jgi:protein-S-isoprenylcysteine O-methyltransferase Ste14